MRSGFFATVFLLALVAPVFFAAFLAAGVVGFFAAVLPVTALGAPTPARSGNRFAAFFPAAFVAGAMLSEASRYSTWHTSQKNARRRFSPSCLRQVSLLPSRGQIDLVCTW